MLGTAYPFRGGLAAFNERLMQVFQEMGYEVKIYTFTLQYPSILFPGKTQYSTDAPPQGLEIEQVLNSINPFNWWKVGRRIAAEKPDILLCRFWLPFMAPALGTVARLVKKNQHTKVISLVDNIIPHEKRIGDKFLSHYFLRACHGFVSMSRSVQKELSEFTNNPNSIFIPHPIYDTYGEIVDKTEARKQLNLPTDAKIMLFFGFIRKYKGLDLLLECMTNPEIRAANIILVVAGEYYGDKEEYDNFIQNNNLQNTVIQFPDFIPNESVKYYFSAADVVVQTYKTATQSGISQMAYHFEKPMIVTDVGGLPEIVPHERCGYVCRVDVADISQAILKFYREKKEAEFTEHIRTEKKKFAWDFMAQGILDLAEQIPLK